MAQPYTIPALPPQAQLETRKVLKALVSANRNLAELKGRAATIPCAQKRQPKRGRQIPRCTFARIFRPETTQEHHLKQQSDFDVSDPERNHRRISQNSRNRNSQSAKRSDHLRSAAKCGCDCHAHVRSGNLHQCRRPFRSRPAGENGTHSPPI